MSNTPILTIKPGQQVRITGSFMAEFQQQLPAELDFTTFGHVTATELIVDTYDEPVVCRDPEVELVNDGIRTSRRIALFAMWGECQKNGHPLVVKGDREVRMDFTARTLGYEKSWNHLTSGEYERLLDALVRVRDFLAVGQA